MLSIYDGDLKFLEFQQVVDRFPINTRTFHRDMGASITFDPIGHLNQVIGHCPECSNLLAFRSDDTGCDILLMYVKPTATIIDYLHQRTSLPRQKYLKAGATTMSWLIYPACLSRKQQQSVVHLVVVISLYDGFETPELNDLPSPAVNKLYQTPSFSSSDGAEQRHDCLYGKSYTLRFSDQVHVNRVRRLSV